MFEFDEHFDELEIMEAEGYLLQAGEESALPSWAYVGNDVWKLNLDVDASAISHEWRVETEDVA